MAFNATSTPKAASEKNVETQQSTFFACTLSTKHEAARATRGLARATSGSTSRKFRCPETDPADKVAYHHLPAVETVKKFDVETTASPMHNGGALLHRCVTVERVAGHRIGCSGGFVPHAATSQRHALDQADRHVWKNRIQQHA